MVSRNIKKGIVAGTVAAVSIAVFLFWVCQSDFLASLRPDGSAPQPIVSTETQQPTTTGAIAGESVRLRVSDVRGSAERKRSGESLWRSVKPGDELFSDDRIRSARDAVVSLSLGDKSEFELAGRSELGVRELTDTVDEIELALGQLDVSYAAEPERVLKITASENGEREGPVAETREGQFTVQRVGDEVTVAAQMGKVKLTAMAKTVVVEPGTFSRASSTQPPRKPEPIPMEVLLKVAMPKQTAPGAARATVSGRADVGAEVLVNDTLTAVDETGRFRTTVPVRPGRNPVQVISRTPWGSAEKRGSMHVEPAAGEVKDAVVQWGRASEKGEKPASKKGAQ